MIRYWVTNVTWTWLEWQRGGSGRVGHRGKIGDVMYDNYNGVHIFQIKRSLTLDQKRHHGREHSLMPIFLVNIIKNPSYFINI